MEASKLPTSPFVETNSTPMRQQPQHNRTDTSTNEDGASPLGESYPTLVSTSSNHGKLKRLGSLEAAQSLRIPSAKKQQQHHAVSGSGDSRAHSAAGRNDLNRSDLVRLLSYLEGELQARDVVIAALHAEKAKQLLYQAKYGRLGLNDPLAALQRDSDAMGASDDFDEVAIDRMYESQLHQLEKLIAVQRLAHHRAKHVLASAEKRHARTLKELEQERQRSAADVAQGDDVCALLEKEREKLRQELEYQKQECNKIIAEMEKFNKNFTTEKERHKAIVLYLVNERRQLLVKIQEGKQHKSPIEAAHCDSDGAPLSAHSQPPTHSQQQVESLNMHIAEMQKQIKELSSDKAALQRTLSADRQELAALKLHCRNQEEDLRAMRESLHNNSARNNSGSVGGGFGQPQVTRMPSASSVGASSVVSHGTTHQIAIQPATAALPNGDQMQPGSVRIVSSVAPQQQRLSIAKQPAVSPTYASAGIIPTRPQAPFNNATTVGNRVPVAIGPPSAANNRPLSSAKTATTGRPPHPPNTGNVNTAMTYNTSDGVIVRPINPSSIAATTGSGRFITGAAASSSSRMASNFTSSSTDGHQPQLRHIPIQLQSTSSSNGAQQQQVGRAMQSATMVQQQQTATAGQLPASQQLPTTSSSGRKPRQQYLDEAASELAHLETVIFSLTSSGGDGIVSSGGQQKYSTLAEQGRNEGGNATPAVLLVPFIQHSSGQHQPTMTVASTVVRNRFPHSLPSPTLRKAPTHLTSPIDAHPHSASNIAIGSGSPGMKRRASSLPRQNGRLISARSATNVSQLPHRTGQIGDVGSSSKIGRAMQRSASAQHQHTVILSPSQLQQSQQSTLIRNGGLVVPGGARIGRRSPTPQPSRPLPPTSDAQSKAGAATTSPLLANNGKAQRDEGGSAPTSLATKYAEAPTVSKTTKNAADAAAVRNKSEQAASKSASTSPSKKSSFLKAIGGVAKIGKKATA